MADLNKVMLIGRLTRDPQLRYLPSQSAVCDFGLAVGRKFKTASGESKEETAFIDCTVFGKGGEIFSQYMTKGKQVFIEGRLKFDQWDDKTTGQKRSKLNVVVEDFQFLGSKNDGAGNGGNAGGGDEGGGYSQRDNAGGNYAGGNAGGGNAGGSRPGGYGSAPARRPAPTGGSAGGPPPGRAPAAQQPDPEPPYGDEQQFGDDDIPF